MNKVRKPRLVAALVAAAWLSIPAAFAAQPISIGVVSSQGAADVFVAAALGYFTDQGLDAKLVQFPSAAPIANAAASGDVDFGSSGMTAALINLAGGGAIRVIASASWEHPNFPTLGFVVSNQAYDKGLHTIADLGGHSVGITQVGTSLQYNLAMVLKKRGIP
jgi:NitT/TauT family transport system substrate-binding protein